MHRPLPAILMLLNAWSLHAFVANAAKQHSAVCQTSLAMSTSPLPLIAKAELAQASDIVELTVRVFFGELGTDYGFNNNRAMAFFELSGEQTQSIRSTLSSSESQCFCAVDGTTLVGFVMLSDEGKLTNLAVDPSCRRSGLGRALVERVLAADISNSPRPLVTLEVDADNDAALALYERCGFVRTGEELGTRYVVDWWRGRIVEKINKVSMQHEPVE